MDFFLTAVAFIVIFSIIVLIHEGGHFFAARKVGIKVEEFGFGLPPRIWGFKKGETLYSINAIPFGGFVRLLGEDRREAKHLKNKRSFIAQPPRIRIMVIVAGVLMNYLLALLLLSVGFAVGMQPLILDGDDVLANIDNGIIQIRQGIVVKDVTAGGAASSAGLKAGDRINLIDGREIIYADELRKVIDNTGGKPVVFDVTRDGKNFRIQMKSGEKGGLGFSTYDVLFLPRIAIWDVKPDSSSFRAGLRAGDVILEINGKHVYFVDEFSSVSSKNAVSEYMVERSSGITNVNSELPRKELVLISSILPDTPAEKAGFRKGDLIVSLDGTVVTTPEETIAYNREHALKDIRYAVRRDGEVVHINVKPQENGLIGIGLSRIFSYENDELGIYGTDVATSIIKIRNISYPFWIAPLRAFEESGRLAVLTVRMFGDVIGSVVTKFTVPEGVAGVVGIAQLTHVFVQEGAMPLMRFMALLSLSLAIINIFPFPALDGGKLLFILMEVVTGRRIGAKFESIIHTIGFVLLMLLILAVTYNDILRIFT